MENEMVASTDIQAITADVVKIDALCAQLMKSKHYAAMGPAGVYAIVNKAVSLGINPIEALNGSLYYVNGKVEMSAILMAKLIRQKKHSITLDRTSDSTICILHGKRADNGDTWRASFSLADAKRAGLLDRRGGPWDKYPDIMCYNRALSKLARQLFPDVIGNCYVEGEISDAPPLYSQNKIQEIEASEIVPDTITDSQAAELEAMIGDDVEYKSLVQDFLMKRFGSDKFTCIPVSLHQTIFDKIAAHSKAAHESDENGKSKVA